MLERAKHLLLQDQQSISEIALATGFSDQSHFSKQFKRLTGITPGDLFNNHRSYKFHCIVMPYVNIQITKGATRAQKAELVKDVTDSLVRVLGKHPEHIHIVIQEIDDENWVFPGLLTDEWKQQSSISFKDD